MAALEDALHAGTATTTDGSSQAFTSVLGSDKTLKRKESWMDKLTKRKRGKIAGSGWISRKGSRKDRPAKS